MGIYKLYEFLCKKAPKCIKKTNINEYRGHYISIDASIFMYKYLIKIKNKNECLKNNKNEITNHIFGFLYKTINMLNNQIIPIYVFDGRPPYLKYIQKHRNKNIIKKKIKNKKNIYLKYKTVVTKMGIKQLMKFLSDHAPSSIKETKYDAYTGRKLAIDASTSLYQFMIAIRDGEQFANLTNEAGEITSHLSGMLSRTVKLLEHGIKPVYVFDGVPPDMKRDELRKRSSKRNDATESLENAIEDGDQNEIKKFTQRTVRVTKKQNQDVQNLLTLMGLPVVDSPSEAEAQCARMARAGVVYAAATEDMDALTFSAPILVRNLNFSEAGKNKKGVLEVRLDVALEELEINMDQFIDFCILCGCDYCGTIRGIGPNKAFDLIKKYINIDDVMKALDPEKYPPPESWEYAKARELFRNPEIADPEKIEIEWKDPDYDGLKKFLVEENNFSEVRIDNFLKRLKDSRSKTSQMRLENFFGGAPSAKKAPKDAKSKAAPKSKTGAGRKPVVTASAKKVKK
eukprot:GHVL01005216.1.p1 GENE.GHVL01005216.1~~GHVL01005216.1.p1  ORF type:complete len:527 (-),score=149.80 GHVL01005216.1:277-1815(-)